MNTHETGRHAPSPPRWYDLTEHEDCGRACPCWQRAMREEREAREECERRGGEAVLALCYLACWFIAGILALAALARWAA